MHPISSLFAAAAVGILSASTAHAALVRKTVDYVAGDTKMTGVLIFDDAAKSIQPGLVLVPNWMGINEPNLKQAEHVAGMGYIVFVADMYGKTVRPKDSAEAGKASGAVKADRALMRARMQTALAQLRSAAKTYRAKLNVQMLGAIGFCFGGTAALELARSGADIKGVVSFHGGLDAPFAYDPKAVKAAVLVLHGADDPYVPVEQVSDFQNEMRENGWNWELVSYGGAVHSFTDLDANMKGQAEYNPQVATRAYARMQAFYAEVMFGPMMPPK